MGVRRLKGGGEKERTPPFASSPPKTGRCLFLVGQKNWEHIISRGGGKGGK